MSLSVTTQSPVLAPTRSLQAALKLFENELTKEQKQSFLQSNPTLTPSDVIVLIAEIDAANQSSRRSSSSRLFTFLDAAQQFVNVVDTFVSSNPIVAALVWGGIKSTLVIANNSLPYFDRVTAMITDIGKLSPTYSEFGKLYQDNHQIQTALCDYYTVIINICTATVKLYSRPGLFSRFLSSFEVHFKPLLEDLEKERKRLHVCLHLASQKISSESARMIDREHRVNARHRRLAARFQSSSLQEQVQIRSALTNQNRQQLLDNMSKVKTRQTWSMIQSQRVSGTTEWFVQEPAFQSWYQSPQTSTIWCSGQMGVGKSVLVSSVVAYLERIRPPSSQITYHFCQTGQEETLSARGVLGSISRQFLVGFVGQLKDDQLQVLVEKSSDASVQDCVEILELCLVRSTGRPCFIILDGLDECPESDIATILCQLRKLTEDSRFCIRLLYSCRSDLESIISRYSGYDARVDLVKEKTQQDIEIFIKVTLQQCVDEEKLILTNPALFLTIMKVLEENHGGMFLWVSLFIEELCVQNNEADIIDALDHPPEGIKELYSRKLLRIRAHRLSKECLRVLRYAGVAKQPLKVEEMRDALSVDLNQREYDAKRLPSDMNRIVIACSGLIHIDEGTGQLRYVHSSLHLYLFGETNEEVEGFNYEDVNLHFGSICLTYFSYQNFTKQVTLAPKSTPKFEPLDIALAQFPSSKGLSSKVVQKFLRSWKSGASADAQLLRSLFQDEPVNSSLNFDFFEYVSMNWLHQVKNLVPIKSSDFWKILHRCVEDRNLNEWKPWLRSGEGSLQHSNESNETTLWALANKHDALIFHQLMHATSSMGDETAKQVLKYVVKLGNEAAVVAVRDYLKTERIRSRMRAESLKAYTADMLMDLVGEADISGLKVLIAAGANVNTPTTNNRLPLHLASEEGRLEMVELLLAGGADVSAPPRCATPLHFASLYGHLQVVKKLLVAGSYVNAVDYEGKTPLYYASNGEHIEIVKVLLSAGADVNIASDNMITPLMDATSNGDVEVVEALLAAGAHVNTPDPGGWTPLQQASCDGNLQIVKALLAAGSNVSLTNNSGSSALDFARFSQMKDIEEVLMQYQPQNTSNVEESDLKIASSQLQTT